MKVLYLLLICFAPLNMANASTSSWSATAERIRVDVPGKLYQSITLANPNSFPVTNGYYGKITWYFSAPYHHAVDAWLCVAELCDPISRLSGQSNVFKGLNVKLPLYFQFRLSPGKADPVLIEGIKVLVNTDSHPKLNPE